MPRTKEQNAARIALVSARPLGFNSAVSLIAKRAKPFFSLARESRCPIPSSRAAKLLNVLDLKKIEENLYQGENETENGARLFGGQVLAQASAAAYRTVDKVHLHSLHAYFLRPGRVDRPVLYEVERVRDGRSFVTRRMVAIQNGQAIFNMDASFQADELGLEHSAPMPNVPPPRELREDVEVARELGGAQADPADESYGEDRSPLSPAFCL